MKQPGRGAAGAMLLLVSCIAGEAQESTIRVMPPQENTIRGEYATPKGSGPDRRGAFVGPTDQIFPHIASGGGWETVIVLVNMSTVTINFQQRFFGEDGRPMQVTFRNYPEGEIRTTTAIEGTLRAGSSFNYALFDSQPTTVAGWGTLTYDATAGRIGGYALFRQRVPERNTAFEALVPLSAYDDTRFFMPFDNIQGFTTAIAIANPASNLTNRISITAMALDGTVLLRDSITLPPSGQTSFVLSDRFPGLVNRLGTLYIQSDITRLSAMGIRFNTAANFVFSSIPIMNWSGMF